jgi:AcrR family transcriptional regulator
LSLNAARRVLEADGLDGAVSLRPIAAATRRRHCIFIFTSKEAIYTEMLRGSLANLAADVTRATLRSKTPAERLRAAAMAFFNYYADNPRDHNLGFYLFRGGPKPRGLGNERDQALNVSLAAALTPITNAAEVLGARSDAAKILMVDTFAHAAGLLLLAHTGRMRLFGVSAANLMQRFVDNKIAALADIRRSRR